MVLSPSVRFYEKMLTQAVCVCGCEVDVSGEQADASLRCLRCGRRVASDDASLPELMEDDQDFELQLYPQPATAKSQTTPSQESVSDTLYGGAPRSAPPTDDPDATIAASHHPASTAASSFELNGLPAEEISATPPPSPPSPSHLSGSAHGSKYDLTERVMYPMNKPTVSATPYTGPNEYEIHRILRVHQRGGMGRILVAYDQYLKREVAVKELHKDVAEDEGIVRRFIGEAEITAQLEHPGVVPIHRLGQGTDGLPYYTMKMIKGETLQEAIKAYHRKPTRQELLNLVRRLVSISKTMAFAHSKGVIHRDLKPANMMLGEHGETLVMDWGLAKPYGQVVDEPYTSVIHRTKQPRPELTSVGSIVGTPAFMSPEQANAEEKVVGPLSDVFSLGTVLYYLLAGQTAFAGRSTQEVLNKVRACHPIPPSQFKSTVPLGLEAICLKAMEKLPENRYQGAAEFADDLCRWLDHEPILAMKDTFVSQVRRQLLYYRISLRGVVLALLLSLLASIGVWLMERSRTVGEQNPPPQNFMIRLGHGESYYEYRPGEQFRQRFHLEGLDLEKLNLDGLNLEGEVPMSIRELLSETPIEWIEIDFDVP